MCEWEAIKSLPDFCAGTFTPTYPWELTAKDIGETNDEQTSVYIHGEEWDSCNVHAFCLVGVRSDRAAIDPPTLNLLSFPHGIRSTPRALCSRRRPH